MASNQAGKPPKSHSETKKDILNGDYHPNNISYYHQFQNNKRIKQKTNIFYKQAKN